MVEVPVPLPTGAVAVLLLEYFVVLKYEEEADGPTGTCVYELVVGYGAEDEPPIGRVLPDEGT